MVRANDFLEEVRREGGVGAVKDMGVSTGRGRKVEPKPVTASRATDRTAPPSHREIDRADACQPKQGARPRLMIVAPCADK